eukprot:SAG22_NODE_14975_length_360_cov_0.977011_1_plen_28_part_10
MDDAKPTFSNCSNDTVSRSIYETKIERF